MLNSSIYKFTTSEVEKLAYIYKTVSTNLILR